VGLASFNSFLAVYADSIGMHDVAPVLFVFAVVTVCSRLFGARFNDTVPRRTMATIAIVAAAVALYTMALWQAPIGIYVAAVMLAVGMSYMYPTFVLIGVDAAPDSERGSVVGTLTAFTDISNAIGGLALGYVAGWTSYRGAFGIAGGLITVSLVMLLAGVALPRTRTVEVRMATASGEPVL
jgi:MFS family permease